MTDTGTALAAILITVWPSAGQVAEPATTLLTCRAAADAALVGRGNPLYIPEGEQAASAAAYQQRRNKPGSFLAGTVSTGTTVADLPRYRLLALLGVSDGIGKIVVGSRERLYFVGAVRAPLAGCDAFLICS